MSGWIRTVLSTVAGRFSCQPKKSVAIFLKNPKKDYPKKDYPKKDYPRKDYQKGLPKKCYALFSSKSYSPSFLRNYIWKLNASGRCFCIFKKFAALFFDWQLKRPATVKLFFQHTPSRFAGIL